MPIIGTPISEDLLDVFGTREGMEFKVGVDNLATYADLNDNEDDGEISDAIDDDLAEAANEMRIAWREFTDVELDFSNEMEERWLADTNEYGAAVKAWNGRNIRLAQTEDVPEQIATALDEWTKRLEKLRTGAVLLDYMDDEDVEDPNEFGAQDAPVSALPTVDRNGRTVSETPRGVTWDANLPGYRWS